MGRRAAAEQSAALFFGARRLHPTIICGSFDDNFILAIIIRIQPFDYKMHTGCVSPLTPLVAMIISL
jgi:hypothetical protein